MFVIINFRVSGTVDRSDLCLFDVANLHNTECRLDSQLSVSGNEFSAADGDL